MYKLFNLVIGCGQCGEMFAGQFEEDLDYFSCLLNFNRDTDKLEDHIKIIKKGGTGRKKELGQQWYFENQKEIQNFILDIFKDAEKEQKIPIRDVLIVSGESGGSGSAISENLRKFLNLKYPDINIFLMSILPSISEGVFFREESLKCLKKIREELNEGLLKGVFLISNEYVSKISKIPLPPGEKINSYILSFLKEIAYPINNYELDFSDSHKQPDFGDYRTVISLPKEFIKSENDGTGFMDILYGKYENNKINLKSVYSDSVDSNSTKSYFGVLKLPESMKGNKNLINKIFKKVDTITKSEIPFKITYNTNVENPEIFVLLSGCNISKKLMKEIDSIKKGKNKFHEKNEKTFKTENDIFDNDFFN